MNKHFMLLAALMMSGSGAMANDFHPDFPLLDKNGAPVIESPVVESPVIEARSIASPPSASAS